MNEMQHCLAIEGVVLVGGGPAFQIRPNPKGIFIIANIVVIIADNNETSLK